MLHKNPSLLHCSPPTVSFILSHYPLEAIPAKANSSQLCLIEFDQKQTNRGWAAVTRLQRRAQPAHCSTSFQQRVWSERWKNIMCHWATTWPIVITPHCVLFINRLSVISPLDCFNHYVVCVGDRPVWVQWSQPLAGWKHQTAADYRMQRELSGTFFTGKYISAGLI